MVAMSRICGLLGTAMLLASCVVVQEVPHQRGAAVVHPPERAGFNARERRIVRAYFAETRHHGGCPPGLAKKGNGCQPPGQAKKRYVPGRELPAGVRVRPLPPDLEIRIGRPPRGYRYGVVDGDVVKLVVGSMLVIDAIVGLGS